MTTWRTKFFEMERRHIEALDALVALLAIVRANGGWLWAEDQATLRGVVVLLRESGRLP